VQKRWEWITKPDNPYKPEPTDAVGFTKVQEFANALCFWADLFDEDKTRLTTKHWHFHPREFIIQMRKCGWLSTKELAQCIPRQAIEQTTSATGTRLYPSSIINWNTAISRAENYCVDINKMFRKYGISSKKTRISYFLGNSIQETIYFSRKSELGGSGARYAPWYGRGFLQLTWEENYRNYGDFKGWSQLTTASFRDSLETDDEIATDSAGYYWLTCAKKLPNAVCLNRYSESAPTLTLSTLINVCLNYDYHTRTCVGGTTTMNYYASTESEQVARAVNTGNANSTGVVNGLIPRNNVLANVVNVLLEADELNVKKQRE
jgi:hydroxyethylthiazole kinase